MNSIPNFPEFAPVSKENIQEIRQATAKNPPEICDLSGGNIWGYRATLNYRVTRLEGCILIHSMPAQGLDTGMPTFFLPPLCNDMSNAVELMKKSLAFMNEKYGTGIFSSVPEKLAKIAMETGLKTVEKRDDADYIFLAKDFSEFKGGKYQSKRNFANYFYQNTKHEFLDITKNLLRECMELQEKWCNTRKCMFFKSLEMENAAILEMLTNFDSLGLFGAVIKINNKVEAFGVAEKVNNEMATVHIQKANTDFRGIYQAFCQLFAKNQLKDYKFINWEQDLGNAGLRKSKLSYHPHNLLVKYNVSL